MCIGGLELPTDGIRILLSGATQNADHQLRRSPIVGSVSGDGRKWVLGARALGTEHAGHHPTGVSATASAGKIRSDAACALWEAAPQASRRIPPGGSGDRW